MNYDIWNLLHQELDSEITVTFKDSDPFLNTYKGEWPVAQYRNLCRELYNDFVTECRQNIDEMGSVPSYFNDLQSKLNICFHDHFSIDFPEGEIAYPLMYHREKSIPYNDVNNDPFIAIVRCRIVVFNVCIKYLKTQLAIPQVIARKRIRLKAEPKDFRTDYTPKQLSDILVSGKKLKLISDATDTHDFIDIFSGRPLRNPINWTDSIYKLHCFIIGINGHSLIKITAGHWELVKDFFLVDGNKLTANQLRHPFKGENLDLRRLNTFIGNFNHPDSL
jgi:hypothetical protein